MSTIKALVEIEIFNDPEYCSKSKISMNFDRCPSLFLSLCEHFRNKDHDPLHLEFDKQEGRFKKCDQCKAAYQKAISDDCKMVKKTLLDLSNRKPNYIEEK